MSRFRSLFLLALLLALSALACSKDLPGAMKAVPADADVVGSLDAKAALAYVKKILPRVVPAGMKDQIPSFEMLAKQAVQMAGIDISRLTRVHFFAYVGAEDKMALIAEGLGVAGLKGEKKGEHKGVALHDIAGEIRYAQIEKLGTVFAQSDAMLKKVIDTYKGDAKGLGGTERGKMLVELMKVHEDMDLLRVYVLTGELPADAMGALFKINGGGMFLDLDKGLAVTVLSDKEGVDKIAQAVSVGLLTLQTGLMMGGGEDMPIELDKETKNAISGFLGKIKTAKKGDRVTISYKGDLKPLVEKVAMLGAEAYQKETAAAPMAPMPTTAVDKPVPAPAAPAEPAVK